MAYHIKEIRTVPEGKFSDLFGLIGEKVEIEEIVLHRPIRMVGRQFTMKTNELLNKFELDGELCLTTENAMYFLV